MEHLSEESRQRIVAAAERCERELGLESTYVRVGDFASAAYCADLAELDSFLAFNAAGGRTWMVGA
jgi:tRNA nucleotidyltransferase (CCA-adding enzyme)